MAEEQQQEISADDAFGPATPATGAAGRLAAMAGEEQIEETPAESAFTDTPQDPQQEQPFSTEPPELAQGAIETAASAAVPVIEALETPLNAMRAAIQELTDKGPSDLPERIKRSVQAVRDQFGNEPPPTMNFNNIIAKDMIDRGLDPEIALMTGDVVGPAVAVGIDPVNILSGPAGALGRGSAKVAKGLAKAARRTPSPQAEAALSLPGVSMSDRILGLVTKTKPQSIAVARTVPNRIRNARPREELVKDIQGVVKKAQQEKSDIDGELAAARANLMAAKRHKKTDLKNHQVPEEVTDHFIENFENLSRRASVASDEALDVLANSGKEVDLKPVVGKISAAIEGVSVKGIVPKGGPTAQSVGQLNRIKDFLSAASKDGKITATEAKQVIKVLDDEASTIRSALKRGDSVTSSDLKILDIRSTVDDVLKEIPEYREIMRPLAKDTAILKEARKAMAKKNGMQLLFKDKTNRHILQHMDESFQTNFMKEADDFAFTQRARSDDRLLDTIPDIKALQDQIELLTERRDKADAAIERLGVWASGDFDEIVKTLRNEKAEDLVGGAEAISRVLTEDSAQARNIVDDVSDSLIAEGLRRDPSKKTIIDAAKSFAPSGGIGGTVLAFKGGIGPEMFSAIAAALAVGGIQYMRSAGGPMVARALVMGPARTALSKAKISGAKKALGKTGRLLANPDLAIKVAPGFVNQLIQPNSELNTTGRAFLEGDELEELRILTLRADIPNSERAKILSLVNEGIVELSAGDTPKEVEKTSKETKLDFSDVNKILKKGVK